MLYLCKLNSYIFTRAPNSASNLRKTYDKYIVRQSSANTCSLKGKFTTTSVQKYKQETDTSGELYCSQNSRLQLSRCTRECNQIKVSESLQRVFQPPLGYLANSSFINLSLFLSIASVNMFLYSFLPLFLFSSLSLAPFVLLLSVFT